MLSIFVCEDDKVQRRQILQQIEKAIMIEDFDMKIVFETGNPEALLNYLKGNKGLTGLYFLDVDLQHQMNGIELASKIRDYDDLGKIIFITTHSEMTYLTFTYKVEAMDYIIKDDNQLLRERIHECIKVANRRHNNDINEEKKSLSIKVGDRLVSLSHDEIMFFETSPQSHKMIVHLENAEYEYYGSIKDVEVLDQQFVKCHKSFVVNTDRIKNVRVKEREIEMTNGEICLVSFRMLKVVKEIVKGMVN